MNLTIALENCNLSEHEIAVIDVLRNTSNPLTAKEISNTTKIHFSSVYRILKKFVKKNICNELFDRNISSFYVTSNIDIWSEVNTRNILKCIQEITKSIELEEVLEKIVEQMATTLNAKGGAIFLTETDNELIKCYKMINTPVGKFAEKIVNKKITSLTTPYDKPLNNIGLSIKNKTIITGNVLSEFICPTVSKFIADSIQIFGNLEKFIMLPAILDNRNPIGGILLGFEKAHSTITKEKLETMQIFIDQVAIAMSNAIKYQKAVNKN